MTILSHAALTKACEQPLSKVSLPSVREGRQEKRNCIRGLTNERVGKGYGGR
jgi:hypothetical protein